MAAPGKEPRHPISVAAERSGLSQDVLRVWERRYGAVSPSRGPGGQRLYSDADIERLRLMHATSRPGRSIRQIAAMTTEALGRIAAEDAANAPPADASRAGEILEAAFGHVQELEAMPLARELRRGASTLGLAEFVDAIATPLMRRIGEDWRSGSLNIAQEHLATAVLRDLLLDIMRGFTNDGGPRMIVATPAGERHEIGAAMAGAFAAAEGWHVVYLGADLPADDIVSATRAAGARVVALSIVYAGERDRLLDGIRRVREQLPPDISVIVGGAGAREMAPALRALGVVTRDDVTAMAPT